MEKISAYPTHWLETRYPFDAEGRHPVLESEVLTYLQGFKAASVVDVGAGYGSNYNYFAPKLTDAVNWQLLEHDPLLIEAMRLRVPQRVKLIEHSLLDISSALDLPNTDLVMANAVFDLFSEEQFLAFAKPVFAAKVPLYLSLNYTGMGFEPENNHDLEMIAHYEAHMQRPQAFGQAMGAEGPAMMRKLLTELGYKVQMAPSYWHIGPENEVMQSYLLGFMESAIGEMLRSPEEQARLGDWIAEKRSALSLGALSMWVSHQDIWAQV
ncbi:MAG: class I SAM-dependent methyltransferase [Bacteroidota bacterium]